MKKIRFYFWLGIILSLLVSNGFFGNFYPVMAGRNAVTAASTLYVDDSISVNQCNTYNPVTRSCGSGSATAYLGIAGAAGAVQAGDTVLIQPGTYSGGVTIDTNGTASSPITFKANGEGVVIEGSGGVRDAFFITWADYIIVEGLTIQHATRAGIRIDNSHHVTVRNCVFANNTTWGLFTDFSDYTTVEYCEAYGSVNEHGIYISNSSDFPTIRGNRLHNNRGCGLHMNGDLGMGGDGIISNAVVENNVIYENGLGGGSGINMDGVTNSLVRNNLLYNNHASGISLYQIDGGSPSQNNRVVNNTILMPADGRWALNLPDTGGNKVFNNIVLNNHAYRGSILIGTPVLSGFESDYNVVMNRFASDGEGDSILTLPEWQTLGYDQHSFIADSNQLFADAPALNFHLKAGSLAIDKGTALAEVPTDLEGKPRPAGGGYDIGAYEFQPSIVLNGASGDHTISLN
jgi:parallel beta-helix repeat protein